MLLSLALLVACQRAVDADEDGYPAPEDCDDADPAVSPGASEVCNSTDDDCDGAVDEDPSDGAPQYVDADVDGFGDTELPQVSVCAGQRGFSAVSGDCDDTRAGVHPAAAEVCNGLDDDCDEQVDEDAEDALVWYADADGDGYGDPAAEVRACTQPSGAVTDRTDCNDGDAEISPAAEEVWYDGVRQDCGGGRDGDADGDGFDAEVVGGDDCDDTNPRVSPDRDEVCEDGLDNDCDGTTNGCALEGTVSVTTADRSWSGARSYGAAGAALAVLGDVDGDNVPELAAAAPGVDTIYVFAADSTGPLESVEDAVLFGATSSATGAALDSLDVDADAYADLLVGAPATGDPEQRGGACLVLGPFSGEHDLEDAGQCFAGPSAGSQAGADVSRLGDRDGDSLPEILVGAPYAGSGGVVYLLLSDGALSAAGEVALADGDATVSGAASELLGLRVDALGDVDGDGVEDMAAAGADAVYAFSGLGAGDHTTADADWAYTGGPAASAPLGDLDGDGYDDIAVMTSVASDARVLYLLRGPLPDRVDGAEAALSGVSFTDAVRGGDLDGDGADELLLTDAVAPYSGAVYVVPADVSGSVTAVSAATAVLFGTSGNLLGSGLDTIGDADQDGYDDVILGAAGASGGLGSVFLFYGGGG